MITVLLAEDHVMVREGLRALLAQEAGIRVLGEASNGREAVALTRSLAPDVVVMDIGMPLLNGLEAVRQILRSHPNTKLLMLSAYSDEAYVEKAIALGATGYLIKQTASCVLSEAIRKVHSGGTFFSAPVAKRRSDLKNMTLVGRQRRSVKAVSHLSSREMEVLQLIAEGKMNKETADELGISIKTVENHRQNLMKKLDIHDTAGLTRHAISAGMIENHVNIVIT